MNTPTLVKQGSRMWQGVMKAWNTVQSGLEQHDPTTWSEIHRQPLFSNRFLTNEYGIKWGMEPKTKMRGWAEKGYHALKGIARGNEHGWKIFQELTRIRRAARAAPQLFEHLVANIPWVAGPPPAATTGQWVAVKEESGHIEFVYHITDPNTQTTILYRKYNISKLNLLGHNQRYPNHAREVQVIKAREPRGIILEYNPTEDTEEDQTLWLWGSDWMHNLEWDPKEWTWRRIGVLTDTMILNYSTKRG